MEQGLDPCLAPGIDPGLDTGIGLTLNLRFSPNILVSTLKCCAVLKRLMVNHNFRTLFFMMSSVMAVRTAVLVSNTEQAILL